MTPHPQDRLSPASVGVVVGVTLGNMVSSLGVITGTFGVFLEPITHEFGWSRSAFSAVLLVLAVIGLAGYPIFGRIADRWRPQPLLIWGNLLFAASLAGLSLSSPSTVQTYVLFAIAAAAGCIPTTVVMAKIVGDWFDRWRGLVFGLTTGLGLTLGFVVMPIVAQHLIGEVGWRQAYVGLAVVVLVVGQIAFWFLTRARTPHVAGPAQVVGAPVPVGDDSMSAAAARRSPVFLSILTGVCLASCATTAVFAHMMAMATDRGVPPEVAVVALSGGRLANGVWQVIMGRAFDRFPRPTIAAPMLLFAVAGMFIVATAESATMFGLGGVLIGIGSGTDYGLLPYSLRRYFGPAAYGEIYGLVFGVNMFWIGAAPLMLALVFDATGSYQTGIIGAAAMVIVGAALVARLPAYDTWRASVGLSPTR